MESNSGSKKSDNDEFVRKSAAKLKSELLNRLDSVEKILANQPLYLSEQFYEIRNEIDIHAETILIYLKNKKKPSEQIDEINKKRQQAMTELAEYEKECMNQNALSDCGNKGFQILTQQQIDDFEEKIKQIRTKIIDEHDRFESMQKLRAAYQQLEQEMKLLFESLNSLIFKRKRVFFFESFFDLFGVLFILDENDSQLSLDEMEKFKFKFLDTFRQNSSTKLTILPLNQDSGSYWGFFSVVFGFNDHRWLRFYVILTNFHQKFLLSISKISTENNNNVIDLAELPSTEIGPIYKSNEELDSIKQLWLTNFVNLNELNNNDAFLFRNLTNSLKELWILNCDLKSPNAEMFQLLPNLTTLSLEKNKIERISTVWFSGMKQLKCLLLSCNPVQTIEPNAFESPQQSIEEFSLTIKIPDNKDIDLILLKQVKIFRLNYCGFDVQEIVKKSIQNPQELEQLELNNNSIKEISHHLNLFSNLKFLNLSSNQISSLGDENISIDSLKNLESLDLSKNLLIELKANMFNKLTRLKTLKLHGNQISKIDDEAFKGLYQLTYLDLYDNRIDFQTHSKSFASNLPNIADLCLFPHYSRWQD